MREHGLGRLFDVAQKMSGRIPRVHARINKADHVRNRVVSKHHVHFGLTVLIVVNVVEPLREMRRQPAVSVALKEHPCAAAEHSFVGGHPLDAEAVGNRQRLFRDAALRRPNAPRTHPKYLLMKVERTHQLLARVFGMAKPVLRQGQTRRRNRARVGVADQRKNRMIKRRRRNFDRSLLGGARVGRQNFGQQFPLARDYKTLIFKRIIAFFPDQRRNVRVFQKEFVEPCDLRQHLQVGEIPRLKIFLRFLGRLPMLPEALPQLPVARIPTDQVRRVGLKKILQGKLSLLQRQVLCRLGGHLKKRILRRPRNVVLNLNDQRRHQIEVLVNIGKLIQQLHHAVVVLEGMQAHPRQAILARHQILVKGLVLVPEKDETQGGHGWKSQSSMGIRAWTRTNERGSKCLLRPIPNSVLKLTAEPMRLQCEPDPPS